jgi:YVTN family beta-propeller protein
MSEDDLSTQLLAEINSPIRDNRRKAVDELARFVTGADLTMAAAARRMLQRLTDDDSRSVAAAAASILERTGVRVTPDRVDFGQVAPETAYLVAEVVVDGPPLALGAAAVTASGPGLRAMLAGRRLRIAWQPQSDWLDGTVTVRGPAGWADVRVTGQVARSAPTPGTVVEEWLGAVDTDPGAARATVLPPPARRKRRATALIAGLTALVLLGGVGVAVALTRDGEAERRPAAVAAPTTTPPSSSAARALRSVPRVPLAARAVVSVDKPSVVGTIRVGAEPEGVAVSPNGKTVYVANQSSRILSVVDVAGRRVTSVKLRNTPRFVTMSQDGRLVFVSMYEWDLSGNGVAVVDAARHKVVRYVKTGVQPFTLAVDPDGRLWVPIHSEGRLEVFTADGRRETGEVEVPPNPHAVAFSADRMRAFTANHESNAVAVIDMRDDRVIDSIPVSRSPHSVAVSPDGQRVLAAGYEGHTANLIDARTLRRTGPFKVGRKPQSVAFAADGEHAYVVNEGDNTVSVLNGRTGTVTATVKVGRSPRTVGISPDGRMAYVSNGNDNTISVLRVGK